MKFKVNVEEIVAQTFEIEANSQEEALEKARKMYDAVELVLEPGNLLETKFSIVE